MSMQPKNRPVNTSKRKFFKTIIKVTVLSEDAAVAFDSLAGLGSFIMTGDGVGKTEVVKTERLAPSHAAQQLLRLGSEPEFFKLNSHGEDV